MKKAVSRVLCFVLSSLMAFYCVDLTALAYEGPESVNAENTIVSESSFDDENDEEVLIIDSGDDELIVEDFSDNSIQEDEEIAGTEESSDEEVADDENSEDAINDFDENSDDETNEIVENSEDAINDFAENSDDEINEIVENSDDEINDDIENSEDVADDSSDEIATEDAVESEEVVEIPQTVSEIEIDEDEIFYVEDFDNDSLLYDYLDSKISGSKNTVYFSGNMSGNKLSGINQLMYEKAKNLFVRVANGEEEYCVSELKFSELGIDTEKSYTAAELGVSSIVNSDGGLSDEAKTAIKKKYGLDTYNSSEIFKAVLRDCPYERYWMGLQCSTNGIGYRQTSENGEYKISLYGDNLSIYFKVSADYVSTKGVYYVDTTKTKAVSKAIDKVNSIVEKAKDSSDLEKVKYYKNQICQLTDYNYDAANDSNIEYGNPWQLIWIFDGDPNTKVVCEGYAKGFAYLCEKTAFSDAGIYCYLVTGNANNGPHMWNILHWSDNKNYLVDIAFCDTANSDAFFMKNPVSGTAGSDYAFNSSGSKVYYYFDSETKKAYTVKELTLNVEIYAELTDFYVNYDSNIIAGKPATFTVLKQGGTSNCQYKLDYIKPTGQGVYGGTQFLTTHMFETTFDSAGTYELKFTIKDVGDGNKSVSDTISVQVYEDKNAAKVTGLFKRDDGKWIYFKDGVRQSNYTGLVYHTDGNWYYVQKGEIVWGVNTLVQYNGTWYYVKNSTVNFGFTGIFGYGGTDYYIQKGVLKWGVDGLVSVSGTWYYLKNSAVQKNYSNLVYHNGSWYYVQKGILVWGVNTLVQYNGTWYYVKNSKVDFNFTGIFGYGGTDYYIQKGVLKWGVEGLVNYNGTWYYVKNSAVQKNYSNLVYHSGSWYYVQKGILVWGVNTLVQYNGTWYYVKNSTVDFNYTGIFTYGGTDYYIQKGAIKWGVNGLTNVGGTWYYLKNSALQKGYTGLVQLGSSWYYVQKGVLKWGENTLVQYNGTWYYVKNSTVDFTFTGVFEYGGTDYYIQKGAIKWGVNGLTNVGGTWYYLKNSAVVKGYTGLVEYNNTLYYVQKGVLKWGYYGTVTYNGKKYDVRNSTANKQ